MHFYTFMYTYIQYSYVIIQLYNIVRYVIIVIYAIEDSKSFMNRFHDILKYDLNFTLIKLETQSECNGRVKYDQYLLQSEFNENAFRR